MQWHAGKRSSFFKSGFVKDRTVLSSVELQKENGGSSHLLLPPFSDLALLLHPWNSSRLDTVQVFETWYLEISGDWVVVFRFREALIVLLPGLGD